MPTEPSMNYRLTHANGTPPWEILVVEGVATATSPQGQQVNVNVPSDIVGIAQALAEAVPEAFHLNGPGAITIECSAEFVDALPLILRSSDRQWFIQGEWATEDESGVVFINGKEWGAAADNAVLPLNEPPWEDYFELVHSAWAVVGLAGIHSEYCFTGTIGQLNSILGIEIYAIHDGDSDDEFRVFPLSDPLDHLIDFVSRGLFLRDWGYFEPHHPRGKRAMECAFIDVIEHPEFLYEYEHKGHESTFLYRFLIPPSWEDIVEPYEWGPWPEEWTLTPPIDKVLRDGFLARLRERNPDYSIELPKPDSD